MRTEEITGLARVVADDEPCVVSTGAGVSTVIVSTDSSSLPGAWLAPQASIETIACRAIGPGPGSAGIHPARAVDVLRLLDWWAPPR